MFDISFGQLFLVLIIGLVVLGPQRLPVAIKTVAGWIKALRAISASVQLELSKEMKLQELQESLKQAEESGLKNITPEIQASIEELKRVTTAMQKSYQEEIQKPLKSAVTPPTPVKSKPESEPEPVLELESKSEPDEK